jgi:hypothetical protein
MLALIVLGAISMIAAGIVLTVTGNRERRFAREHAGSGKLAVGITITAIGFAVLVFSGLYALLEAIGPIWGP